MNFLQDEALQLKSKGLLTLLISLEREDITYSIDELANINKDGIDGIRAALKELDQTGYLVRKKARDKKGRFTKTKYLIKANPELNLPKLDNPTLDKPRRKNPDMDKPTLDNPTLAKTIPDKQKVFDCYSDNIHPISGVIEIGKLTDCIEHYGADVVNKAIEQAVRQNKRTLSYIEAILRNWGNNGYRDKAKKVTDKYDVNF